MGINRLYERNTKVMGKQSHKGGASGPLQPCLNHKPGATPLRVNLILKASGRLSFYFDSRE